MLVRLNEKERKKMNRIAKWDNAKFVLIILVVICHFYKNCKSSTISAGLFVYENVWLFCIRYYEWRNIYIG